jgi:hypothetical protein
MKNRANADRVFLRLVGDGITKDYVVEFTRAVMAVTCMCDLHAAVDGEGATSVGGLRVFPAALYAADGFRVRH